MDMMDFLATKEAKYFKCYFILKKLIKENEEFRNTLAEGLKEGKVSGFDDSMWCAIRSQNLRSSMTFEDVFKFGYNMGNCTGCSIQYSYSLNHPYICGGVLPIIKGTQNSPDGRHTWIESGDKIIDTTLMLVIDKDFAKKFGYIEENRRNPNMDPRYVAAKDFANDPNIRRGR